MYRRHWLSALSVVGTLLLAATAQAQVRPYIGYVYPAGGQQGTTVRVKLGGQGLDGLCGVHVTGPGVQARVAEYQRRINFQDLQLLNEQLKELKKGTSAEKRRYDPKNPPPPPPEVDEPTRNLIDRIQKRIADFVPQPACASMREHRVHRGHARPRRGAGRTRESA